MFCHKCLGVPLFVLIFSKLVCIGFSLGTSEARRSSVRGIDDSEDSVYRVMEVMCGTSLVCESLRVVQLSQVFGEIGQ
jgi:hypothetical protein